MHAGSVIQALVQIPHSARRQINALKVAPAKSGWSARLSLQYAFGDGRTHLSAKAHCGPLAVQKSLYPEGPRVCHTLILHPPGGIVGGDALDVGVNLQTGSQTLITTPGAAKWYRSTGATATQRLNLNVDTDAILEWLPQETIVFNGAVAKLHAAIDLAEGGNYLGWDILCLGRTAAGEKFDSGSFYQTTDISIAGTLAWSERCNLKGGSHMLASAAALANAPISGILIAAGKSIPADLLARCRAVTVETPARCGISAMPRVLVARYVGHSCELAKRYFIALWREIRPALTARPAVLPRIWST
jgi:urease accessory protein